MALDVGTVKMWESLRADCRTQDNEIEGRLSQLEGIAQATDDASATRGQRLTEDTEKMLQKMQALVLSMAAVANGLPAGPEATAMVRHTQRFEDIVSEKQRVLRKLEAESRRRRERAGLLSKVHSEISVYNESNDVRTLTSEQDSLRFTQRRTRELIEVAEAARARLAAQRGMFMGISDKVLQVAEKMPYVNALLKKIDQRRRKNVVIMAVVVAVCMLLTFAFW